MRRGTELMFGMKGEKPVREPLHYTLCGLDNVYLCSGFKREFVDGEVYTSVSAVDDLHEMIAFELCVQRRPLLNKEVAFLRKNVGLTQAELGDQLGVSRKAVNEYENGRQIPRPAQIMLQLIVAVELMRRLSARIETDVTRAYHFEPAVDQIASWLVEIRRSRENEVIPAFIIDAAVGSWQRDGDIAA